MKLKEKYLNNTCSNLPLIIAEFERLKGQFVITASWNIERFIGVGDDKQDWYYITYNGRKTTWNTCVGGLIPLKGKLDDEDYNELVRIAKLNHYDQFPETREEAIKEAEKVNGDDEIVIGLYMELN
jgi:hypothetical protein